MILGEHLVRCDTDGIPHENYWYKWTIGRLQQVFLAVSNALIFLPFHRVRCIVLTYYYLL